MSRRAVAPVVGVVLMLAVVVTLAGVVAVFVVGIGGQTDDGPSAVISADRGNGDQYGNPKFTFVHESGDPIDTRDLTVRVFVDGQSIKHQPDVPFFSKTGFVSGPEGPFNSNTANKTWMAGEKASLTIAASNTPQPTPGSEVTVKFYVNGTAAATARA
ncbi:MULTISPECIES: type IV pilin N-terminal domain-containing protein [Halococcus]|uniref:type IV pilin N-terminal domain-containing protein n=1 Tax=Halococcus TaxID=2249 RepID=UPI0009B5BBF2|nr:MULTISPECIES: type IV pilin N-terminal domain-containing protein [Halococcus]